VTSSTARRVTGWDDIDYSVPLPDSFVLPETHWPSLHTAELTPRQRIAANQLAASFSCEMFIHCERYVISYMREHRVRVRQVVTDGALDRFIFEEELHIAAFYRLLNRLRPDTYPSATSVLLKWSWLDRLVLKVAPAVSLFLIAALFEEMSLYVHEVMDEQPAQAYAPIRAVMAQHAVDEQGHIKLDDHVLLKLTDFFPRWLYALQVWLSLPLMLYVDGVLGRAWRKLFTDFAAREQLPASAAKALRARRPSRSDVIGIERFVAKLRGAPLPGSRLLCAALSLATK